MRRVIDVHSTLCLWNSSGCISSVCHRAHYYWLCWRMGSIIVHDCIFYRFSLFYLSSHWIDWYLFIKSINPTLIKEMKGQDWGFYGNVKSFHGILWDFMWFYDISWDFLCVFLCDYMRFFVIFFWESVQDFIGEIYPSRKWVDDDHRKVLLQCHVSVHITFLSKINKRWMLLICYQTFGRGDNEMMLLSISACLWKMRQIVRCGVSLVTWEVLHTLFDKKDDIFLQNLIVKNS